MGDTQLHTCMRIRADHGQIEQVVVNLAVSARDAMPAGGTLTIETHNLQLDHEYAHRHISVSHERYVMLAVNDTGKGNLCDRKLAAGWMLFR